MKTEKTLTGLFGFFGSVAAGLPTLAGILFKESLLTTRIK